MAGGSGELPTNLDDRLQWQTGYIDAKRAKLM